MSPFRIGFSAMLAVGLAAFATSPAPAATDQPDVARVSALRGSVDVKRADSGDTVLATINAPLNVGDYVATHDDARAEVQFGYATALRVAPATSVRFVALDGEHHRAQLAAGTVELRVARSLRAHPEIETPQATIRPTQSGRYRVSVGSDDTTTVTVRSGYADVVTDAGTHHVEAGAALAVGGSSADPSIRTVVAEAGDDFDRWNDERDRTLGRANAYGYVDDGMVGADDLVAYGRWLDNPRYGRVWSPSEGESWAPYHDGRFVWEPYYGWTWVAAEPWGWAPYHYGNWFYAAGSGWCWYPGAYAFAQPFVYRPAIVAFFSFGGGGSSFGFGNIGWVPLAPYEAFTPWYGRFHNTTIVNNITNVTVAGAVTATSARTGNVFRIYHNSTAPGGAVAVDRRAFATGNFVNVMGVTPTTLAKSVPVRGFVPIVPTTDNLRFGAQPVAVVSNPSLGNRFARFAPPELRPRPFANQQAAIRAATSAASTPAFATPHVGMPNVVIPSLGTPTATSPIAVSHPVLGRPFMTRPVRLVPIDSSASGSVIAHPAMPGGATIVHPGTIAPAGRERPVEIVRPNSPWDRFGERAIPVNRGIVRTDESRQRVAEPLTIVVPPTQRRNELVPSRRSIDAPVTTIAPHAGTQALPPPAQVAPQHPGSASIHTYRENTGAPRSPSHS